MVSHPISASVDALSEAITRLRSLTQTSIQTGWRYCDEDLSIAQATQPETWQSWSIAPLNEKDHLAWTKGNRARWFGQVITVPQDLQGYPLTGLTLRVAATWWATNAQLFVNGTFVQEGDLFDVSTRLLLSNAIAPGDTFAIAIRLISPGHDDGALVRSVCHYESSSDAPEPSFIADELDVLRLYLQTFAPEELPLLTEAITAIDWSILSSPPASSLRKLFDQALATLRDRLLPLSPFIKQRRIRLLGHAHLDMAWLWTVAETWNAAERTFESALNLQKDFPELIFCHSTPALYEWIEQNRPALFKQIREAIATGWWEPVGGLWIEPELNIISGESMVRHVLYGQRYFQEKFGSINRMAWLPDSFGFTWQLPQILKQGGIDYFVTQKLRWNDTTKFPYEVFQWQAPDGTEIFSLMSASIGEGIDPIKMATYACDWEAKTGIPDVLWLPGVGDHGGGPTRDMLEIARRWQRSPFFPQLEFSTALDYLQDLEANFKSDAAKGSTTEDQRSIAQAQLVVNEPSTIVNESLTAPNETQNSKLSSFSPPLAPHPSHLPLWDSDLYLEFHRGCHTTHADQKHFNRHSEELLYQAELWASLATISASVNYPKRDLETAWKKVLFNQFHDILPGSSITEVFDDANQAWEEATKLGQEIKQHSLATIAQQIALPPPPHPDAKAIVVFNPLNWERSHVIGVDICLSSGDPDSWRIFDLEGQIITAQRFYSLDRGLCGISFFAEQIPAVGYRTYWLCPYESTTETIESHSFVLENEFLRVIVDSKTGDLASIFDKIHQREVLNGLGNELQAFEDKGQYWDAWNIDPKYAQYPLPSATLLTIESSQKPFQRKNDYVQNALEKYIYIERKIGASIFKQFYVLQQDSPNLEIRTFVDWQERHVVVKAAFPLNLETDYATYEIPCGAIERTTKPESEREKAQWEVPAMHWADLSDGNYGVSLLNDCKHGYDAKPDQLRLTLLRGSEWPDPEADKGRHSFTYALYPHAGDWKAAQTVKHGYELNMPLIAQVIAASGDDRPKTLPPTASLLDLGAENLVLMAFKQSEDAPDEWILRCYECHGEPAQLTFQSDLDLALEQPVDLLERPTTAQTTQGQTATVHPWKIASFKVKRSATSGQVSAQPSAQDQSDRVTD
ncbi:alpha-mannosidase [Phormidium sp. FACHB-592]|uniref:Alpha-mannosidase n=1 Tax=Stenomitos frigidus AS-A4 TaxID=2933935 RepID=A0ABV0KI86_9CYAN|nr:alpha-mannosidase [Phormidium sp. FACHB-592]